LTLAEAVDAAREALNMKREEKRVEKEER